MTTEPAVPLDDFKPREIEILTLMAEGLSNKEIGERLFITTQTVRWYNKQIYSKLGTSRRTEAIALARSMRLIGADDDDADDSAQDRRHHLPITNGPFVGRDDDLTQLAALLQQPEVRLVSLIAAGGMGKSRLSLELGNRIQAEYANGAVFIDLAPIRTADNIAITALSHFGITPQGNQDPRELLFDYCREKHLLLIFDNMEHVLDGAALLADLLKAAPNVTLIATSRAKLNLRVETTYLLQPVTQEAAQLFVEVAAMMHPAVQFGADDWQFIDELVALVGGMPLALTLAATWVDMLSVQEIAAEIRGNLDFLSAELGDMPERQRSIHAVIDPTWGRLKDSEKRAFMWASVFRGGFTWELFQKLTDESIRTLQTLINRSLVMHGYDRRYTMHPLLRHYAREKLEQSGELDAARSAHLSAMIAFVDAQNARMHDETYIDALEVIDRELDNCRAALDWTMAGNALEDGCTLAQHLYDFWNTRSHALEAERILSALLAHPLSAEQQGWLRMQRGRFRWRTGNMDAVLEDTQAALTIAEDLGDKALQSDSLRLLSIITPVDRLENIERAYRIATAIDDSKRMASCLVSMSIFVNEQGDEQTALEQLQQAEAIFMSLGNLQGVSMTRYNSGLIYANRGDTAQARECYRQSLEMKRQIGDRAGMARRLAVLAYQHVLDEELEEADAYLQESRTICEDIGDRHRLTFTLEVQAIIAYVQTNFDAARSILEHGLTIVEALHNNSRLITYHSFLTLVYLNLRDVQRAQTHLHHGIQVTAQHKTDENIWMCVSAYAQVAWVTHEQALSLRLTAIAHHYAESGSEFDQRYFLKPQVYRVQQHFDDMAWEQVLADAAESSLEQHFATLINADD